MKTLPYRLVYRVHRVYSWVKYHALRRFTPAGLAVLASLWFCIGMGVDMDQSLAYQVACLLGAMLLAALLASMFFRARFTAERLLPRFATAGTRLIYQVTVQNHTRRPQRGLALLENLADPRPGLAEFLAVEQAVARRSRSLRLARRRARSSSLARIKPQPLPDLPPQGKATVKVELLPLRRGHLRFEALTVARPDPLGLLRSFARLPLPQTTLVLPRRYPLPPLDLPGTLKYQQGGVSLASSVGESEEFVALRDYRPGDPLRHIHWKSWARTGKPVVREFQDEFFVRHALILDTFGEDSATAVFEEAVSAAASLACTIQTQESLLDLMFVGPRAYCFTAGRSLAHGDQMLEILAGVQICHDQPFATLQQLVLQHLEALAGCLCIFLRWDSDRQELVRRLRLLGMPLLVMVVVEPGQATGVDPGPMRDRPEWFHVMECDQMAGALAKLGAAKALA